LNNKITTEKKHINIFNEENSDIIENIIYKIKSELYSKFNSSFFGLGGIVKFNINEYNKIYIRFSPTLSLFNNYTYTCTNEQEKNILKREKWLDYLKNDLNLKLSNSNEELLMNEYNIKFITNLLRRLIVEKEDTTIKNINDNFIPKNIKDYTIYSNIIEVVDIINTTEFKGDNRKLVINDIIIKLDLPILIRFLS